MACAAVVVLGADLTAVAARIADSPSPEPATVVAERPMLARAPKTTTSVAPAPPSTEAAPPPTEPPPPPTTTTLPPGRLGAWTVAPYQGLGVWLDVYDWTNELTGGMPKVQVADIDRMADLGIETLFIQTAHRRSPSDVIEPDRLRAFIERAHARNIAVVAWYLPMLEDLPLDLQRLMAASELPVDGLGIDIESLAVEDPVERTRRLLVLSNALRGRIGTKAISAITPSAVHLQVVNPGFWPGFPWPELGAIYDVIVPMSYWSVRRPEWRSGERYVAENIDRIRASTGRPDMPVHVAGGIADGVTLDDLRGMVAAIQARGTRGGSLYDWNTSQPPQWELLRALRVGG